jgi:hypothetical protein
MGDRDDDSTTVSGVDSGILNQRASRGRVSTEDNAQIHIFLPNYHHRRSFEGASTSSEPHIATLYTPVGRIIGTHRDR